VSLVNGYLSSRASKKAAQAQAKSADQSIDFQRESRDKSIAFQRESRDLARNDLQPFREFGEGQIGPLNKLLSNPNGYLKNNKLFDTINSNSQRQIFANKAARGKLGSGGTALELQNRFLANGEGLINSQYNRLLGATSAGQNAAAGQANIAQNTGASIGNTLLNTGASVGETLLQKGNAIAAGKVGSANAWSNAINQSVGLLSYGGYGKPA